LVKGFRQTFDLVGARPFTRQEQRSIGRLCLQEGEAALLARDLTALLEVTQVVEMGFDQGTPRLLTALAALDDAFQLPNRMGELRGVWVLDGQWEFPG
jgi:hypothetical protein